MILFECERPQDGPFIETLLDTVFGPDRTRKSSYRLREARPPLAEFSQVAREGAQLLATVRYWPVIIRDMLIGTQTGALLLGPLGVHPGKRGRKLGQILVRRSLAAVDSAGVAHVILVGDPAYFKGFGFHPALPRYITMPGGVDADRLLIRSSGLSQSLPSVGQVVPCIDYTARSAAASDHLTAVR